MQSTKVTLFHAVHQEALMLDFGVLEKMLRSNRAAHGRTKYHQRLDMACRCLRKRNILQLHADYLTMTQKLSELVERKQKQKKREQVFWEFQPKSSSSSSRESDPETLQVLDQLQEIRERVRTGLPEAIQRLEFASEALFQEMARGFFLPLCSIAVAAVARVRVLLQNLGSQILYEWPGWEKGLETFGKTVTSTIAWDSESMKQLQQSFHPPKEARSNNQQPNNNEVQELLLDLGVDLTTPQEGVNDEASDAIENDTSTNFAPNVETNEEKPPAQVIDTLDLGERLSSHGATREEESAPDYMETAVNQVQSNLALSKKAKASATTTISKAAPKTDSSLSKASTSCQESIDKHKPDSDSVPQVTQKKKKKTKRKKDSSKPKSSKKAKSSGDFFDKLFK